MTHRLVAARRGTWTVVVAAIIVLVVALTAAVPAGRAGAVPLADAEGDAMAFGPAGGAVAGGTVTVLERPDLATVTDAAGHWRLDGLEVGTEATFVLDAPGRPTVQTATFTVPAAGLRQVSFQSPDDQLFAGFAQVLGVQPDPFRCQLATTVTRRGHSLYGPAGSHGEPGAVAWIDPSPAAATAADGPVYFNLLQADVIWPDRSLEETTADGGVVWANVTPGRYVLRATAPGAVIAPVVVRCRAGVLVNASPPWGLQVVAGGLEPGAPYPSSTTTTTTTSPTTTSAAAPTDPFPTASPAAATGLSAAGRAPDRASGLTPRFTG